MKFVNFIFYFTLVILAMGNQKYKQSDQILLFYLPNPFQVTGKASGVLQPEKVSIGITAETLDKSATSSLDQNSQIIANTIAAFKKLGLTEDEFSTTGIQVYPSYTSVYNKDTQVYTQVFEGYKVRNSITVDTQNIDLAGKVIDAAVQNGITNIDFINYSPLPDSIVKLREKLLAEAVRNAKLQASIVLEELNYEIVSIKNIQILDQRFINYSDYTGNSAVKADTLTFGPTSIQEVQVQVSYIIKSTNDNDKD